MPPAPRVPWSPILIPLSLFPSADPSHGLLGCPPVFLSMYLGAVRANRIGDGWQASRKARLLEDGVVVRLALERMQAALQAKPSRKGPRTPPSRWSVAQGRAADNTGGEDDAASVDGDFGGGFVSDDGTTPTAGPAAVRPGPRVL